MYTIHTLEHEGDFFYAVFEEQSEQVIDFYYFYDDALKVSKFMEKGGAFNGFTPAFILRTVPKITSNLNEEFNTLITD